MFSGTPYKRRVKSQPLTALLDSENFLLLGITVVRPEKGRKIAALCLFLMLLGTSLFPSSTKPTLPLIPGLRVKCLHCAEGHQTVKKDLKRGSLWGWGRGAVLFKSQVGLSSGTACNGTGDPVGTGSVILPGPWQETHPA